MREVFERYRKPEVVERQNYITSQQCTFPKQRVERV